ncbi:MAG: DUF5985 family protein [Pseudomonadota bacterium]
MNFILLGAVIMGFFIVSLIFLRSWRTTSDRFFLFFSISFFIEGASRLMLSLMNYSNEQEPFFYIPRLLAFLIILYAVAEKNGLWRSQK